MAQPPHHPDWLYPGYLGPPPPPNTLQPPQQAPGPLGPPGPHNVYHPPLTGPIPANMSPFPVHSQGGNYFGFQGPQQPAAVPQPLYQVAAPPPGYPDAQALPEDSELYRRIRDFYRVSDVEPSVDIWLEFFTKNADVKIGPRYSKSRRALKTLREGLWTGLASKRHWIKDNKIWMVSEESFKRTLASTTVVAESGKYIILRGGVQRTDAASGLVREAAWLAHAHWVQITKNKWTLDQQDESRQLELLQRDIDNGFSTPMTDYSIARQKAKLERLAQKDTSGENKEWRMNLYHVQIFDDNPIIQGQWAELIPPAPMLL